MSEPRDAPARQAALDPERSFIVQAPAGSGKTALLTQRFLALLARVERPEEVAAVTFTRKAAGEMKRRLLEALAAARRDSRPDAAHDALTWDLARAVLERDRAAGWRLEENPQRLKLFTIDALCAAIVRGLPVLSGLGGGVAPAAETARALYREAARRALARLDSDPVRAPWVERLLLQLNSQWKRAETLLIDMLARRDQWLRHVVRPDRSELEAALARIVADGVFRAAEAAPLGLATSIADLGGYAAGHLLAADSRSPITRLAGLDRLPGTTPEDLPLWQGVAELLLTLEGGWRKTHNKNLGFPAQGAGRDPEEKALFKAKKAEIKALMEDLAGEELFRARLEAVRTLPNPHYGEDQWAVLEALSQLLVAATGELRLLFAERGEADFTETALKAGEALGTPDDPTDLALAWDYRLHHLLVDEFQDTSVTQWRLLEKLTGGWQRGDGRTLFLVGDPMQSIYRFRQAEVGLFLRAWEKGLGGVELTPLALSVNFRSRPGVVAWVNRAFPDIFPDRPDPDAGAVSYHPSEAFRPEGEEGASAVRIYPFLGKDIAGMAAQTVEIVRAARAANPTGSVGVLARARSHLTPVLAALKGAGIPYQAVEVEGLAKKPAIRDLVSLTRALHHPADRVAWLAVLRAPWCGLPLSDLWTLAGGGGILWEAMNDPQRVAQLSPDGKTRLLLLRETLGQAIQERGRRDPARWVEGVWLALGGPACRRPEDEDPADAETFFTLLESLTEGGTIPDMGLLEERVEQLYAAPSPDGGAVQAMTIHKAKGLEFDTVVLPGLGQPPPPGGRPLLVWMERGERGEDLALAPIPGAETKAEPIYDWARDAEKEKGEHEIARLLYVAATRARERLHLIGHAGVAEGDDGDGPVVRQPAAGSFLARLWPVAEDVYREALDQAPPATAADDEALLPIRPLRRLAVDWQAPPPPEGPSLDRPLAVPEGEPIEFLWAGETARLVGTVVHRQLHRLAVEGVEEATVDDIRSRRAAYRAALTDLGIAPGELEEAVERVTGALTGAIADPRGRWILSGTHGEARSEYALAAFKEGGVPAEAVMDRTFVDDTGTRWIIDYKTSVHTGGGLEAFLDNEEIRYRSQLAFYAQLMQQREKRPIRLGLYFPLLKGWREWSP